MNKNEQLSLDGVDPQVFQALSWVDLLIFAEVQRLRARGRALAKDAPWGAYIGEAEVDEILGELLDVGPFQLDDDIASGLRELLASRRAELIAGRDGGEPAGKLRQLAAAFQLQDDDLDLLSLAMAAEVNARYLRLFAYLQDDFGARYLTPALALRLLAEQRAERMLLARRLGPDAPLLRCRLLLSVPDEEQASKPLGARPLRMAPRLARWLLQDERWDSELHPWCRLQPAKERSIRPSVAVAVDALALSLSSCPDAVLRVDARSRRDALEAAGQLSHKRQAPLLVVDLRAAARLGVSLRDFAPPLAREARMQGAVLLILDPPAPEAGVDPLAGLLLATEGSSQPLLLHGAEPGVGESYGEGRRFLELPLPRLSLAERQLAWTSALRSVDAAEALDPDSLARRFRFSGGQIAQVLDLATDLSAAAGAERPSAAQVLQACREAFLPDLGPLAQSVPVRRGWGELIVPADAGRLLSELVSQVERREEVLEALGSRVRPGERGIKALFSGPPGTGKSLSAEVIANELGYPLFRVDLASVVSKWVGETEKHLGQLFRSAEESPCVLLFDEADALFGKRSDVKGAQDRFANLEVSYLLQRLESFDGIAILTSNLKRNIDEAFLRRFTFVIDFPFPEAEQRLRIWEGVLSERYPLAPGVELQDVAEEFKLAGGNIWNVAVAAACAAAATEDGLITRQMLAHAVLREYQKMGREVAALRPKLLADGGGKGGSKAEHSGMPRQLAMSAAQARQLRQGGKNPEGDAQ